MKTYHFEEINKCEMCGDNTNNHKIIGQRLNKSQGFDPKNKHGIAVSILKFTKCNLIYTNPQPIPIDIQEHYGIPPESYWKAEQFNYDPNYFSGQIKAAKELLPFHDGMVALDIGAGLGKCMISLSNAGFNTYGLEPSLPFFERALSKMRLSPERLKNSTVEDVYYDENSFDFITYGAVFEHLHHPKETLIKALDWLKPKGIIHLEVPSSNYFISKLINAYFKLIGTNYVTNLSPMHSPFHLYEFDLESFRILGKKLGFQIVKHHFDVCTIPAHIPSILHPLLRWHMEKTNSGMQLTLYIRKLDIK